MARFSMTPDGPVPYTPEQEAARDAEEAAWAAQEGNRLAEQIRRKRNALLQECDWLVVKHLELNENIPGSWEVYRQALRNVPQQPNFPFDVTWPEKPV